MKKLRIIECPRDAMQGWHNFIPTEKKIAYINGILKCGFDTVDFGSFVSPKAVPQMKDTVEVLNGLDQSNSELLAIIANERGAKEAASHERIDYLGFPFSVSEEFQKRNTNSTIAQSFERVKKIQDIALKNKKQLVIYLSMGFGNPYGERWHPDIVAHWAEKLNHEIGVTIQAVSDTVGSASPDVVSALFELLIPALPNVEFGAHLHTVPENANKLLAAAFDVGCRRFDGAIKGYGGCPMATDALIGNMPSEKMIDFFENRGAENGIQKDAFEKSMIAANEIFR